MLLHTKVPILFNFFLNFREIAKVPILFNFLLNFREIVSEEELVEAESSDGVKRFLGKKMAKELSLCNFLIPIPLQPSVVNLRYYKNSFIFLPVIICISKMYKITTVKM